MKRQDRHPLTALPLTKPARASPVLAHSKAGRGLLDPCDEREADGGGVLCGCVEGSAVPADSTLRICGSGKSSRKERNTATAEPARQGHQRSGKETKSSPAERSSKGQRPARGRLTARDPTQERREVMEGKYRLRGGRGEWEEEEKDGNVM
ncbi:hypothetical protein R3P38DRAFT_2786729 [Favolaschia claudopus]|uniref:Uncharacterized protein n=1 Tax=Favolaschia claudopus TaxID=2862362 RepID=A0AAW0ARX3_9AGAR